MDQGTAFDSGKEFVGIERAVTGEVESRAFAARIFLRRYGTLEFEPPDRIVDLDVTIRDQEALDGWKFPSGGAGSAAVPVGAAVVQPNQRYIRMVQRHQGQNKVA